MLIAHYLPYLLIGVAVFVIYMAAVNVFRSDRMRERVKSVATNISITDQDDVTPASVAFCNSILSILGVDTKQQKERSLLLAQAGFSQPHALTYFLFARTVLQPIVLVLGIVLLIKLALFSADMPRSGKLLDLLLGALLVIAGLFGTTLYINNAKQHRQKLLLRAFPEALDLLLVCIESGLGLDAALARVCRELQRTRPVVAYELERTRIELAMMSDRVQALQNLAERTDTVSYRSLVASLIQTEKFGTSLVDTLRVLSDDQRVTRLLNAENKAARIPVLISIPLIVCILPSLFIVILGPPVVRVMAQGGLFGEAGKSK